MRLPLSWPPSLRGAREGVRECVWGGEGETGPGRRRQGRRGPHARGTVEEADVAPVHKKVEDGEEEGKREVHHDAGCVAGAPKGSMRGGV